jgi:hypothetical protein
VQPAQHPYLPPERAARFSFLCRRDSPFALGLRLLKPTAGIRPQAGPARQATLYLDGDEKRSLPLHRKLLPKPLR